MNEKMNYERLFNDSECQLKYTEAKQKALLHPSEHLEEIKGEIIREINKQNRHSSNRTQYHWSSVTGKYMEKFKDYTGKSDIETREIFTFINNRFDELCINSLDEVYKNFTEVSKILGIEGQKDFIKEIVGMYHFSNMYILLQIVGDEYTKGTK